MSDNIAVVTTWDEFREQWASRQNFIMRGEVFPFNFPPPPGAEVVEGLRRNEKTRILHADPDGTLIYDHFPEFRDLPIEEALEAKASLAHFDTLEFAGNGQVFEGLGPIFDGWYDSLTQHGFTWSASQRAVFYSGPDANTKYHYDSSYVLVWQIAGIKEFCWLKEPERWCPHEVRRAHADMYTDMPRPADITPDDVIVCEMHPGDVLWNVMLTPHWVNAPRGASWSLNITHFELRCDGQLSEIGIEHEGILRDRATARAAAAEVTAIDEAAAEVAAPAAAN